MNKKTIEFLKQLVYTILVIVAGGIIASLPGALIATILMIRKWKKL